MMQNWENVFIITIIRWRMNRRRFLTASAALFPLITGCASLTAFGQEQPPEITSKSVEVTESHCIEEGSGEQRAEASYEASS